MDVCTAERLRMDQLESLFTGKALALRVPGYFPVETSDFIADRLKTSTLYGKYRNAPLIGRLGQAFFESLASKEQEDQYWKHAVEWIESLRTQCSPSLTPMDKLRLELDELWPAGATLQTLDGRKMFVGLVRIFGAQSYAEPHQDHLEWTAVNCRQEVRLVTQLAGNVYLRLPEQGGELVIWNSSLDREDYARNQVENSYGLKINMEQLESVRIKPQVGDLVLFDSRKIHAVCASDSGERITWSFFVGYRGPGEPLTLWS